MCSSRPSEAHPHYAPHTTRCRPSATNACPGEHKCSLLGDFVRFWVGAMLAPAFEERPLRGKRDSYGDTCGVEAVQDVPGLSIVQQGLTHAEAAVIGSCALIWLRDSRKTALSGGASSAAAAACRPRPAGAGNQCPVSDV